MATITTKYSIGYTVYFADTTLTRKQHACPDCKGTRKWQALSPANRTYEFSCPRCSASYHANHALCLDYSAHAPMVAKLTIGSIETHTPSSPDGHYFPVKYMAHETGVGSGRVYDENKLFETHEEAMTVATLMAASHDKALDWIGKQYDQSLSISDYEIDTAAVKEARERADRLGYSVGYLLDDLIGCETVAEVTERIEKWRSDRS